MIVFKDAEKHEPKEEKDHLCIIKDEVGNLIYDLVYWDGISWWLNDDKVLAFSETPPETALKGISEDPEEDSKCSHDLVRHGNYINCKKCDYKILG